MRIHVRSKTPVSPTPVATMKMKESSKRSIRTGQSFRLVTVEYRPAVEPYGRSLNLYFKYEKEERGMQKGDILTIAVDSISSCDAVEIFGISTTRNL